MIWLCSESPDAHQLSREWEALTGDSFIVDVRPMYGEIDGFLETFKYALKFSDLELSDNLHAYKTLKGKRLINSFGALRGVEVPEELTDDDLDEDLPYMLMLYTYRKGSGYNFSEQWEDAPSTPIVYNHAQTLPYSAYTDSLRNFSNSPFANLQYGQGKLCKGHRPL